jgi:hypothetical protein
MADGTEKTPDEFRVQVETGKTPLELTAQMKWNIAETISRIREDGIELGAGDYVDVNDLKYICQAASFLLLYAQQLEVERDAAVADLREIVQACGEPCCEYCEWNGRSYCAGRCWTHNEGFKWRGVQKED